MTRFPYAEKKYVVCVEYIADDGRVQVMRSAPTTRKAAQKRRREFEELKKGNRCWVQKVEEDKDPWHHAYRSNL